MYCYHCGKKINEAAVEKKHSGAFIETEVAENATFGYVCPRCGHLIHSDGSEEDIKSLSRASHAQIQRAKNFFARGMGSASIGIIALIIAILFFFLAKKPSNHYELVTNCAEFYVFVVLAIVAGLLLIFGCIHIVIGVSRNRHYSRLLQDINNRTFVQ